MKITIIAKPKRKKEFVDMVDSEHFLVSVTEPPVDGRANDAIVKALSRFFGINKNEIFLISGGTSKIKVFEVPDKLKDFEVLPTQKSLFKINTQR